MKSKEFKKPFTILHENSTMSLAEVTELYDYMRKEDFLKQFCDLSKIKYRENINQYYIVIHRKQYTANSKRALIEKLYNAFNADTLADAYKEWMLWRRDIGTAPKTLKENANEWKHFIKDTSLASTKLTEIDVQALEDFFYQITKDFAITSKRLTNVNSVLNGIFKRCISRKLLQANPMAQVDMQTFRRRCKPQNHTQDNYSTEERKAILSYLADNDEIYSLAIQFSLYVCLRIGEILAIRPEDFKDGYLYISRSKRTYQLMNDDLTFSEQIVSNEERIKGNKDDGFRRIPLTDKAMAIVEKVIALNPDSEFLFMRNGKQLSGDRFNEKLRAVCDHLGIKYRSSHQIRFTTATMFYQAGVPVNQLSSLLGHSDTATTWHYIRQSRADGDTLEIMKSVLD
jgi:integrase